MPWRQKGDKPLPESMIAKLYMYASSNLGGIVINQHMFTYELSKQLVHQVNCVDYRNS